MSTLNPPISGLQHVTTISVLLWTVLGYIAWLVLYRGFVSRLARANIPGPRLAALTSWYECYYDVVQPAQYVFKIKQLHAEYGPIVRIGPNDISISDPDFVDAIYGPGPGHKRDKDYEKNKALGVDSSMGGAIPHDLHRKRREALNPFFSPQRIAKSLEHQLRAKTTQLESLIVNAKATGEVVNLSDIYFAFANDMVHAYSFGDTPNLLNDLALSTTRRANVAAVLRSVKIMLHFSWVRDLTQMPPASIGSFIMPPGVRDMMTFRHGIRTQIDRILDTNAKSQEPNSIFSHRDKAQLPPSEKTAQRLEDEATLLVMAGTYSPMLSLITAHYHLLAQPGIMDKLRAELADHDTATTPQPERLPYLSAIIQESHRLTFGLTGRNARVCSDENIVYTDEVKKRSYLLPSGTSLSASTVVIHTNEELFPDPWNFDPERWMITDLDLLRRRRKAMLGFGRGPRICIGMHLANAEMTMVLAAMARWDMRLFETTEDDVAFRHDYHVLCPRLGSKGMRVEVLGRSSGM